MPKCQFTFRSETFMADRSLKCQHQWSQQESLSTYCVGEQTNPSCPMRQKTRHKRIQHGRAEGFPHLFQPLWTPLDWFGRRRAKATGMPRAVVGSLGGTTTMTLTVSYSSWKRFRFGSLIFNVMFPSDQSTSCKVRKQQDVVWNCGRKKENRWRSMNNSCLVVDSTQIDEKSELFILTALARAEQVTVRTCSTFWTRCAIENAKTREKK